MMPIGTSFGKRPRPRSAAFWGAPPSGSRSYTNLERTCLMISSPIPVTETAPCGPEYKPAPRIGESPTRPGSMNDVPPVELAAANRPRRSRATAPTVSVGYVRNFRAHAGTLPATIWRRVSASRSRAPSVATSNAGKPALRGRVGGGGRGEPLAGALRRDVERGEAGLAREPRRPRPRKEHVRRVHDL